MENELERNAVRPYLLGNLPWYDKTVELWLTMASTPRLP